MTRVWPNTSCGSCPTVMLWHEMPEDSNVASHVDWLLAREAEASSPLICFRLDRPLYELPVGAAIIAERIRDHRTAYLTYQGPISGNRGEVKRIAEGVTAAVRAVEGGQTELDVRWHVEGRCPSEMTVSMRPEGKSGNCQVKMLANAALSRYK